MRRILIILLASISTALAQQAPDTIWTREYGGDQYDEGKQVLEESNGDLVIVGSTMSYGNGGKDVYLIKTNSNGDTLWTHTYGDENNNSGKAIIKFQNYWYAIAGYTINPYHGDEDMYFIKCRPDGLGAIARFYGDHLNQQAFCITAGQDSGFVLAGSYEQDTWPHILHAYAIHINNSGQLIWTRNYSEDDASIAFAIKTIPSGGYALTGRSRDSWAAAFNINREGHIYWNSNLFSGSANAIILDYLGRSIIGGDRYSYPDSINAFLIQQNHLTLFPYYEVRCIANSNDNTYMVCGGNWRVYSDTSFVAKVDTTGQQIWQERFPEVFATSIIQTQDGGYVFTGVKSNNVFLAKIAPDNPVAVPDEQIPKNFSLSQNYPNPFNAATTISYEMPKASNVTIEIYDIGGRKVADFDEGKQTAGKHAVQWNAGGNSSGVYFYIIRAGDFSETKKLVLMK